jgi:hypothetical protein
MISIWLHLQNDRKTRKKLQKFESDLAKFSQVVAEHRRNRGARERSLASARPPGKQLPRSRRRTGDERRRSMPARGTNRPRSRRRPQGGHCACHLTFVTPASRHVGATSPQKTFRPRTFAFVLMYNSVIFSGQTQFIQGSLRAYKS